jgi:uncharacterized membrane protein
LSHTRSAGVTLIAESVEPNNGRFFRGLAAGAVGAVGGHAAAGTYAVAHLTEYYLPYALLLAWGEAFITGMSMALMVAYYPQWILLFDDKRYLAQR